MVGCGLVCESSSRWTVVGRSRDQNDFLRIHKNALQFLPICDNLLEENNRSLMLMVQENRSEPAVALHGDCNSVKSKATP